MNKDLTDKLLKFFKNDIIDEEDKSLELFSQLFNSCKTKLERLLESYLAGLFLDPKKYIAYHIVEDMDKIIENAENLWYKASGDIESSRSITGFILALKSAISSKNLELQKLVALNRDIVFDKKSDIDKLKEEFKQMDDFLAPQKAND